jgi:hypothetical protein
MSAEKIVYALLAELEKEFGKDAGTGAAIAAGMIKQVGKTLVSEMKSNQDFHDRVAQIVDPTFVPSPVAVVQRSGKDALVAVLNRLTTGALKKIATTRNLTTAAELTGLAKPAMITLIAERAEREAMSQHRF